MLDPDLRTQAALASIIMLIEACKRTFTITANPESLEQLQDTQSLLEGLQLTLIGYATSRKGMKDEQFLLDLRERLMAIGSDLRILAIDIVSRGELMSDHGRTVRRKKGISAVALR